MKKTIRLIIPGILSSLNIAYASVIDLVRTGTENLLASEGNSASKMDQKLSNGTTAMPGRSVDDIHRSGATTTHEAVNLLRKRSVQKIYDNRRSVNSNILISDFTNRLIVTDDGCSCTLR